MSQQKISIYQQQIQKHQTFLKKFNIFPSQSRKAIYAQLLQLPLNHQHFAQLTKPYPLLPQHTNDKRVAFTVAAISKLYPDVAVQWLPGMVHPFVIMFRQDAIAGFETALTFLLSWLRPLFANYPNPPKRVMSFLGRQLPQLERRVNQLDYPLSAILQPLLLVVLTDVLNKDQTLRVFDFLVSRPFSPQLYICIAATIVSLLQDQLCKLSSVEDIALALRRQKKLDIGQIIQTACQLAKRQQQQLLSIYGQVVFPLSKGRYPVAQFIKNDPLPTNLKLQQSQQQNMERVKDKFAYLQSLIDNKLRQGTVANMQDINKRYQEVEGQMRQYLGQLKEQHRKKMVALREMEDTFKSKIEQQGKDRAKQYELELEAIERRGRVERQLQLMHEQAESIRRAEKAMMLRLQQVAAEKQQELVAQNQRLRVQQRSLV